MTQKALLSDVLGVAGSLMGLSGAQLTTAVAFVSAGVRMYVRWKKSRRRPAREEWAELRRLRQEMETTWVAALPPNGPE